MHTDTQVTDLPDVPSLPAAFEAVVTGTADRTALEFGESALTYGTLNASANRLARRLEREGVAPGTRVGVHLSRCLELYTVILAVLKAGGVVVPLNPAHPVDVRRAVVAQAAPPLTLRDVPAGLGSVTAERDAHELLADSQDLDGSNLGIEVDPYSTAFLLFTSGSTGHPKGVEITHRAIARVGSYSGEVKVTADDCFLQLAPYSFAASTTEIWLSLLHGARVVAAPPQLPSLPELARIITERSVTFLNLPCGLFNLLVDGHPQALRGVRTVIVSGDFPSPPHLARALEAVGGTIYNAYGCTENSALTAVHALTEDDVAGGPVPVGRPLPGVGTHVLDESLAPCAPGEVGELCLSGAGLARGYLGQPELTAQKFPTRGGTRLLRTGDMARLTPQGEVVLAGRADQMVKIRGFRVELREVELAAEKSDSVERAVVRAVDARDGLKELVLFCTTVTGEPPATEALLGELRGRLPDYMVPARVHHLTELPLNHNGKLDRMALREPRAVLVEPDREGGEARPAGAEDAVASVIVNLLASATGREPIGTGDSFMLSGANSLQIIQLAAHLHDVMGVEVRAEDIFRLDNAEALADHVRAIRERRTEVPAHD
ncbi:non-ribosomal peptide synthetase [Streptomyces sp. JJ66]|uniref:non-ribosomal peptide synthetase n=1 Tax=Streptomyces sp. JJ66 TaxID=2803843 RepID=UPI001C55BEA9|nr:non-ribosomal peptide synthetase [Streptomyces sp. JJ66]MBW1600590.1 non-ribosomal peptide synthetase [Streptomyces sp. JJ66]